MSGPTAIVDYSRPVGWWCRRTCHDYTLEEGGPPCNACIPRYLPIPEGQRPPAASEVEEAEVVTFTIPGTADPAWCAPPGWTTFKDTAEEIYEIVVGVKAFVTGATE